MLLQWEGFGQPGAWSGRIFSSGGGTVVDFFRWPTGFFQEGANGGENSFYQLRNYEKNIFHQKVNRKISNFKIQQGKAPLPPPSDTHGLLVHNQGLL